MSQKSTKIVTARIFHVEFVLTIKRHWDTILIGIYLFLPVKIINDDLAKEDFAFASAITSKPRSIIADNTRVYGPHERKPDSARSTRRGLFALTNIYGDIRKIKRNPIIEDFSIRLDYNRYNRCRCNRCLCLLLYGTMPTSSKLP